MFDLSAFKNADLFSVGISISASIILGAIAYFENRRSSTNKAFLYFTIASSFWGGVNYISYKFGDELLALWLLRSVLFFATLQALTFFQLTYVFPESSVIYPKLFKKFLIPWTIFVSFITLTPLVFSGVKFADTGAPLPIMNPGIVLFGITAVGLVVGGITLLIKRITKAEKEDRPRFNYFLIGIGIMFSLIIVFNFIFPAFYNNVRFIPFGALFILPFIVFTSYAILRHGLLDIKIISTEILIFVLSIVSFFEIIVADNLPILLFRIAVFVLILIIGIRLIRSVLREVQQREQLQKLSAELATANERLKEVDKAKDEFLSVSSHQLRTPLTAIKGYISMMLEGDYGRLSDQQAATIQIVYDSATRLINLIADLLDLSRIESGRMEFNFEPVNLCEIVESVIAEVANKARSKGLYIYFDKMNRYCPAVKADRDKIRQVVINLIDNGIKYTVKGGLTVRLMQIDGSLQFSVSDTGIGVSAEERDRLFEKYFRTQSATIMTHEGAGLGIYVVKKLVEAHGGKIWFESPGEGKGTTFYFTLPVAVQPIRPERVSIASLEGI